MSVATKKLARVEDELHELAIRQTNFDDFGDPSYRHGLSALLDSFDSDLRLTAGGFEVAYKMILRTLVARLYTVRGWRRHPEALTTSIARPLLITGLPRTGTTALHRLLAVDPQFQGIELWVSEAPMIRPHRDRW